jgi:hypothetical protein
MRCNPTDQKAARGPGAIDGPYHWVSYKGFLLDRRASTCLAQENNDLYISAENKADLAAALECPMISGDSAPR